MDVIDAIKTRRSIRNFQKRTIGDFIVKQILDVSRHAPSAMNSQPWEFIIIRDHKTLNTLSSIHEHSWLLKNAPLAIMVVANETLSPKRYVQDCSVVTQNILLSAHALGLGCCWVAVNSAQDFKIEEKVKKIITMPEDRRVIAIVAIGYHDYIPSEKRLRELDDIVHYDVW